ncbi:MAG: M67 family metallopeptidase [Chloroherpetonaceae bacterium]|nr:M67 family metallopeptidase [Chloroherpetonaceae bacterium]MDW8437528.1 M67 family metallopeptidase [Chloroherpetonaceae bacterium]
MIINIKISNPRSFRFPSGYSDIDASIIKPIEVHKRLVGSIESGLVARIASPILINGVYGSRLILLMDERTKVSRVMMGYSVWADVFLVPQNVAIASGFVMDSDILRLGTGMIVMVDKEKEIVGDLKIQKSHLLVMTGQAQGAYPEEAGGLLVGMIIDGDLDVRRVVPLENVRQGSRHNRIEINPLDYARIERQALKEGLGVWGFYHSHPNADAIPSEFDRANFPFTNWWYPIIAVGEDRSIRQVRCWKLNDDRESFTELHIEIYDSKPMSQAV